jgi:hypothetical protein
MAGPTGGFPTWVRSDAPDVDMTAGAILALAPDWPRHRELLDAATRAVAHLTATQNTDGGWGRHGDAPSDVLSTAQALPVVVRHGDPHVR